MFHNLPPRYTACSIHIALERADMDKNWTAFKMIYKQNPIRLKQHLFMCDGIFDYNYTKLPLDQQIELFNTEH